MSKYLSAAYECDFCERPLLPDEAPCLSLTNEETGRITHVCHEACLPALLERYGISLGEKAG
jgi:hypothetical protein